MSNIATDTFWEDMWAQYSPEYIAECNAIGHNADLGDFEVWLEDKGLVPEFQDED